MSSKLHGESDLDVPQSMAPVLLGGTLAPDAPDSPDSPLSTEQHGMSTQLKPPEYMSYDGGWFSGHHSEAAEGEHVAWLPFDYDEGKGRNVPGRGEPFEDDDRVSRSFSPRSPNLPAANTC